MIQCNTHIPVLFLSTPSARRATFALCQAGLISKISIHALREEGDRFVEFFIGKLAEFLSTPSARRATSMTCST